jgi:hypothetical protein
MGEAGQNVAAVTEMLTRIQRILDSYLRDFGVVDRSSGAAHRVRQKHHGAAGPEDGARIARGRLPGTVAKTEITS